MPKKAQEWKKDSATRPDPGFLGGTADDWDLWRVTIESQITRLSPGAFPNWQARCEYVAWMDGLGRGEMLYLRYLAYEGVYPITIIYAETGTFPGSIRYPPSQTVFEPPPPYVPPQSTEVQNAQAPPPFRNSMPPILDSQPSLLASFQPMSSPVVTASNQLVRTTSFMGPGRQLGGQSAPGATYRGNHNPRPSHIQSMHSQGHDLRGSHGHNSQASQVRPPQVQTLHVKRPSILSHGMHEPLGLGMAPVSISTNPPQGTDTRHRMVPSQASQGHRNEPPVIPPALPTQQWQDPFAQLHHGLTQLAISNNVPLPPLIETPHHPMQSQGHQYQQSMNPPIGQSQANNARRVSFAAHESHDFGESRPGPDDA